ncbi:MAG: hypothetical protein U0325_19980 [Polyangiales bacterium]
MTCRALRGWGVTAIALWGCDPSPAPPPRPTRPPGVIPRAAPVDASLEGTTGPDAAVPEVIARCVARARSATPDALRGALEVLDEAALLDGACRLDLAPRLRAPDLCAGASLTSLREVCLTRAAMTAGTPDRCPWLGGALRRDPVCVALAARDLALCAAAGAVDRARCEALARDDLTPAPASTPCSATPARARSARCTGSSRGCARSPTRSRRLRPPPWPAARTGP